MKLVQASFVPQKTEPGAYVQLYNKVLHYCMSSTISISPNR